MALAWVWHTAAGAQPVCVWFRGIKLLNGLNNCGNGCSLFTALSVPSRHRPLEMSCCGLKCESPTQRPDLNDQTSSNKTAAGRLLLWGEKHWRQTESLLTDRKNPQRPIWCLCEAMSIVPELTCCSVILPVAQESKHKEAQSNHFFLQFVIPQIL